MEQEGDFLVRTHHVEYCDGGILDPDDVLSDLVEDKDKVRAPLLTCECGKAFGYCRPKYLTKLLSEYEPINKANWLRLYIFVSAK